MKHNYTHNDLRFMDRDTVVRYGDANHRVVLRSERSAGGVGMGEYPATVTVAFNTGLVLSADEWTHEARRVHEAFPGTPTVGQEP